LHGDDVLIKPDGRGQTQEQTGGQRAGHSAGEISHYQSKQLEIDTSFSVLQLQVCGHNEDI